MAPKFLGRNRGTISIQRIIWNWTWQLNTLGKIAGSLKWNELPQQQCASSSTSLELDGIELAQFFWPKQKNTKNKNPRKNWASYVTLSWRTNVKAKKQIHNMHWPGWWRHTELAQGHVAGSIFSFFFVQKQWASYEALSQQRGIEPATWHWASNEGMVNLYCMGPMDFLMQPLQFQQIQLLINFGTIFTIWDKIKDWQSIRMYRYITPTVWLWSIWSNTSFLERDAYPWAGGTLGKATFETWAWVKLPMKLPYEGNQHP